MVANKMATVLSSSFTIVRVESDGASTFGVGSFSFDWGRFCFLARRDFSSAVRINWAQA